MSKSERYARVILKRTNQPGLSGTTAPVTNDHTIQPAWKTTDLYEGELYLNLSDERLYIRTTSGIREIPLSQFTGDPLNIYHAAKDGEGLIYNSATHTWTNQPALGIIHSLSGLTDDVQIGPPPIVKQFLKFNGSKWVNSYITLNYDINDVTITTPLAGQILTYNGSRWINGVPAIEMYSTISGSTDVQLSTPLVGQYLKYNGTKWINATLPTLSALTLLSDVLLTSPSAGQYLKFSGGTWINSTFPTIPTLSALTLSGLTGVLINSPVNDQVLKYNTGSGKWTNSFDRTITGLTWDKYDQKLIIDYQDGYVPITIEGKPIDYITGTTKLIKGLNSTALCYSGVTIILPTASGYSNGDDTYYGTIFKIKLIQTGSITVQCEGISDYIFDDVGVESQSIILSTLGKTITLQSDGLDTWYFI